MEQVALEDDTVAVRIKLTIPGCPLKDRITRDVTSAVSQLDDVRDAYKQVKSLKVAGTISSDIDMNGEQIKNKAEFTGAFESPMKFHHQTIEKSSGQSEAVKSQRFGSTGKKLESHGSNLPGALRRRRTRQTRHHRRDAQTRDPRQRLAA